MIEKDYSQEELKKFFSHEMREEEICKIRDLGMDEIISKLSSPTYRVLYIENVGYMTLGEGYLIMDDGSEPTHYFDNIYSDAESFKEFLLSEGGE